MIKNIVIAFSFSIMLRAYAMEQQSICYLAYLPVDVQSLIAYFVTCDKETDKEFIARTKNIMVPGPEYDQFLTTTRSVFRSTYNKPLPMSNACLRVFCPYQTKVALLRLPSDTQINPILTIIDQKKQEVMLIDEEFDKADYRQIALSRCATMIATVSCEKKLEEGLRRYVDQYKKVLIVKNLIEKSTLQLNVLPYTYISSIGFNTQGTHVIVHYAKYDSVSQKNFIPVPSIFSINNEARKMDIVEKSNVIEIPTLQNYFMEYQVCKSLEGSK